jgi:hypothetical protein
MALLRLPEHLLRTFDGGGEGAPPPLRFSDRRPAFPPPIPKIAPCVQRRPSAHYFTADARCLFSAGSSHDPRLRSLANFFLARSLARVAAFTATVLTLSARDSLRSRSLRPGPSRVNPDRKASETRDDAIRSTHPAVSAAFRCARDITTKLSRTYPMRREAPRDRQRLSCRRR